MTVYEFLFALPNVSCVRNVVVRIKGKEYHGCAYHDSHDAGNAMRLYLLCDQLPACYRRSSRTAFVIDGADWYIACYMVSDATLQNPQFAPYHPCGKHFMLCRWQVPSGESIDRYDLRPYNRVPATLN